MEESQPTEQVHPAPIQASEEHQQHRVADPAERDALAQTAGELVEALREERNPKFKNSQFMGLMRSLADRTSVVDGNDIVLAASAPVNATSTNADAKGKGKERADTIGDPSPTVQANPYSTNAGAISYERFPALSLAHPPTSNDTVASDTTRDSHDEVYEYFKRENEDYIAYQLSANRAAADNNQGIWDEGSQQFEWDKLQGEWDAWEANAVGVRKMSNYQFASDNPYFLGSSTRAHELHSSFDQVGVPGVRITGGGNGDP